MSCLLYLKKSLAKVSGKLSLIKICKRATKLSGKVHSSPYYMDETYRGKSDKNKFKMIDVEAGDIKGKDGKGESEKRRGQKQSFH